MIFFTKRKQKKNELVARPGFVQALQDGGAFVPEDLGMRHLTSRSHEQIKDKIDFIFTEPDLFNNKRGGGGRELQDFYTGTMNRARPVKLLSFYYIFEYVYRPTTSREETAINLYEIKNYNFMIRLHPTGTTVKRPPQAYQPLPHAKRVKHEVKSECKKEPIEEITLDSDDSEENEVVDIKPIIKRELITPKAFSPGEVIDLSSSSEESDEEEEVEEETRSENSRSGH